ncbi:MAG: caspase family protein [Proteobacteria bacterium]|nr:caspase family protein [Pseudomonadota bacterium]
MRRFAGVMALAAMLCMFAVAPPAAAQTMSSVDTALRRFALIIGANDGGTDRVKLHYAHSDARSMARVVRELGGVAATDIELLLDPDSRQINTRFAAIQRKLSKTRRQHQRIELLVYYSGHSDEQGLLLSGKRYSYPDLRQQLRRMPADVKIAILDSCASGAFTRTKGGIKRPAFVIDESSKVRGHAFLSSSSADEAAQESDRIEASFFTHYLVSGLRGAADSNGDNRVTLSEAYQFAFNETVARTQATKYGPQHPAYDMHLVGTGDVVMTDLRMTNASLHLAKDITGRVFIRDASGRLVLEMRKSSGTLVTIGLGPESYQVFLEQGDRLFGATVSLDSGQPVTLTAKHFQAISSEATVARGGTIPGSDSAPGSRSANYVPLTVTFVPGVSTSLGRITTNRVSLNLLVGVGDRLNGIEFGGLVNIRKGDIDGMQIAGLGNFGGGNVRAAQIAGLGNINSGYVSGIQIAGIGNWNGSHVSGTQIAGISNINGGYGRAVQIAGIGNINAGYVRGTQIAGIGNFNSDHVHGIQFAGISNWNGGFTRGGQVAGIANITGGGLRGWQIAGIANVARGNVRGGQIGGITNVANGDVSGTQIGLINIGSYVDGLQLGLINIARRVSGVQFGLVNVAEQHEGIPVGLVTLVKDGHRALEVWSSDIAPVSVGFKFGTPYFYTLAAIRSHDDLFMAGLGLGVHTRRAGYYFDVDLANYGIFDYNFRETKNDMLTELRAMVGFPVFDELSLFAGASLSAVTAFDGKGGTKLTPLESNVYERDDVVVRLSPGLFAGISY